jgi:hypothetical protein
MNMTALFKTTLTISALTLVMAGPVAAGTWDGGITNTAADLGLGTSINKTGANSSKMSWSDNVALTYNAWGMQGSWYSFNLTSASDIIIKATAAAGAMDPAFTLYKTAGYYAGATVGPTTTGVGALASNGAIHSFSAVAQAGQNGLIWATGAAGILDTLAYVNSGNAHAANAFGQAVNAGFNQVDMSNLYASAITGSGVFGSGLAEMDVANLAAGYYTLFIGGANGALVGSAINLNVAAVPVPGAVWLFGSALMGLIGIQRKKMAKILA